MGFRWMSSRCEHVRLRRVAVLYEIFYCTIWVTIYGKLDSLDWFLDGQDEGSGEHIIISFTTSYLDREVEYI